MRITVVIDIDDASAGEYTLKTIANAIEKSIKLYTIFKARVLKIALGDNL